MEENDDCLGSIAQAAALLELKENGVYPYITELTNVKKIERVGSRKSGYWIVKNNR